MEPGLMIKYRLIRGFNEQIYCALTQSHTQVILKLQLDPHERLIKSNIVYEFLGNPLMAIEPDCKNMQLQEDSSTKQSFFLVDNKWKIYRITSEFGQKYKETLLFENTPSKLKEIG